MLPPDLPPWPVVYQQRRRWMAVECFESIVHDLRVLFLAFACLMLHQFTVLTLGL
jgi:hypothetical protein